MRRVHVSMDENTPNENKISRGERERVRLRVEGF
jgi:hypothetical protein